MNDRTQKSPDPNVYVTLGRHSPPIRGTFPCPLCGSALELPQSRTNKPYSICNPCGIQIFFRGRSAIARLKAFLDRGKAGVIPIAPAAPAVIAFGRLEQLRAQKNELEQRRPLIFADRDLENAIS